MQGSSKGTYLVVSGESRGCGGVYPMRAEKNTNPCRDTIPINFFIKVRLLIYIYK